MTDVALTTWPLPARMDEYEEAAAMIERLLAALPGAVAVYRFGSVRAPGISDLDRLVVVRDVQALPDVWSRISPRARYLAMHSPFVADVETFRRHRWFADLSSLELVAGEEVLIEPRPDGEAIQLRLAAEALVVAHLKLSKAAITGRVKVRPFLCELNNLGRNLAFADLDRAAAPEAWTIADVVSDLRHRWWTVAQPERRLAVADVVARARRMLPRVLTLLAERHRNHACPAPRALALGSPWANVTLDPRPEGAREPCAGMRFTRWSRRLGEARWRMLSRHVPVPPPLVCLLQGGGGRAGFDAERRHLVSRYVQFAGGNSGYSLIGDAGIFLGQ